MFHNHYILCYTPWNESTCLETGIMQLTAAAGLKSLYIIRLTQID